MVLSSIIFIYTNKITIASMYAVYLNYISKIATPTFAKYLNNI